MTDILNDISAWSILKWVLLILLAGFIGQFGKTMAQAILAKIRRSRGKDKAASADASIQDDGKGPLTPSAGDSASPLVQAGMAGLDKKALKTLAKSQKKETKQRMKG